MHKRLEAELVSLAHTILQMKNRNDVNALKEKAKELHERLSVLAFVEEYLETTPNATETKEELISKIELAVDSKKVEIADELLQVEEVEEKIEIQHPVQPESTEDQIEEIEVEQEEEKEEEEIIATIAEEPKEAEKEVVFEVEKPEMPEIAELNEVKPEPKKQLTLEEEFKDAVSADVTSDLFSKVEDAKTQTKTSLNDVLQKNIQVGLNDRIAFVKHLFNHSQADFNRVLSQLNSFKTEKEAKSFIKKMVKPDYDWSNKEEFEERFMNLIERKFL